MAGLNQSKYPEALTDQGKRVAVNHEKISSSWTAGFHLGVFTETTIRQISIQSGLFYTKKGGSNDISYSTIDDFYDDKRKLNLNYLEVPVNILYHLPLKFGNVFVGGGPYIAMGLSGSFTEVNTTTSGVIKNEGYIPFGKDEYDLKNLDCGLNGEFGLNLYNKWQFSVNYEYGLTNPSRTVFKSRNETLGLTLGFYFP
jgi:hypothetical protein